MADFKIQRGTATIASSGSSIVITAGGTDYDTPSALTSAFIFISGAKSQGGGIQDTDASGGPDINGIEITNPSNLLTSITFTRSDPTGGPIDIDYEIWEYTGAASGDNEFIVRDESLITAAVSSTTGDTGTISGVVTDADVVVFLTGANATLGARNDAQDLAWTTEWIGGSTLSRVSRGSDTAEAVNVSTATVEFTGSNWKVQRIPHTYVAGATNETEAITTLGSITKAFLHSQSLVNGNGAGPDGMGQVVYISSTSELTFNKQDLASGATGVAWVIENTQASGDVMLVAQYSGTRASNTGANPDSFTQAITSVTALAQTGLAGLGANTTANFDSHQGMLTFKLTAVDTVTMTRGRDVGNRDWRFQVVEFPTEAGGGGVTITDVDTDNTITSDQLNVVTTGTGFGAAQGTGSVTLRSGTVTSTQTIDTWADLSIQADTVQGNIPYTDVNQAVTYRVTNDDTTFDDQVVTLNPIANFQLVTGVAVVTDSTSLYGFVTGGTAVDTDQLDVPDQSDNAQAVTYNADGTFSLGGTGADQLTGVRYWSSVDELWSGPVNITLSDGAIVSSGLTRPLTKSLTSALSSTLTG